MNMVIRLKIGLRRTNPVLVFFKQFPVANEYLYIHELVNILTNVVPPDTRFARIEHRCT